MDKIPLIVIVGPTASGKTALSVELASQISGEIISADSMQIYRYMNIGTAKPSDEEKKGIKHYLIDEVNPDANFSVATYAELACKYIEEIYNKGKIPIMVGGTGLYINTVVNNIQLSETVCDWKYREELQGLANEKGNDYVHVMLEKVDPVAADRLHCNDLRRVIRALEVFKYTGIPISIHQEQSRKQSSPYDICMIGLNVEDRQILYDRIDKRVDIMLAQGLVEEVKGLLEMGYSRELTSMKGLGYKEIIDYLHGIYSLEQTIDILKRDSRRYAKRQLTWFGRDERIEWFDLCNKNVIQKCKFHIETFGII